MDGQSHQCCKSGSNQISVEKKSSLNNGIASFLSTALIILMPKCPFCLAAYSGAFLLFFGDHMDTLSPIFTHAKPVLGLLITLLILFNFNRKKSVIALPIALIAFVFLVLSTYKYIHLVPRWSIYTAFFFAAWYNGNFTSFYRYLTSIQLKQLFNPQS